MFLCEGKCKVEKETPDGTITKRCGLLREIIMNNALTSETKTIELCVFDAIMNSLHRQEQGQVRIQSAVESDRNENANQMEMTRKVIANGLLMGAVAANDLRMAEVERAKIANSEVIECTKVV